MWWFGIFIHMCYHGLSFSSPIFPSLALRISKCFVPLYFAVKTCSVETPSSRFLYSSSSSLILIILIMETIEFIPPLFIIATNILILLLQLFISTSIRLSTRASTTTSSTLHSFKLLVQLFLNYWVNLVCLFNIVIWMRLNSSWMLNLNSLR